jgi:hypothetical protein
MDRVSDIVCNIIRYIFGLKSAKESKKVPSYNMLEESGKNNQKIIIKNFCIKNIPISPCLVHIVVGEKVESR